MDKLWTLVVPFCSDLKSVRLVNKDLKEAADPLFFRKFTIDVDNTSLLAYKQYIRELTLIVQKTTELECFDFIKEMNLKSFDLLGKNYPKKKTIRIPKKMAERIGIVLQDKQLAHISTIFNNLLCWIGDVSVKHVNLYNWTKDVLAIKQHPTITSVSLHNLDCFSHFEELPTISHLEILNFKASSRTLKPMARSFSNVESLIIEVPSSIHVRDYDFACFPNLRKLTCYHCSAYPIPETLDYIDFYGILYCQIKYFLAKKLKGLQILVKVNDINDLFDVKVEPMVNFLRQVRQLEYFSLGFQMENAVMYISDVPHLFKPNCAVEDMDEVIKCPDKYTLACKFDPQVKSDLFYSLGAIFCGLVKDAGMISQQTVELFLQPFNNNLKTQIEDLNGNLPFFDENTVRQYMGHEE